MAKNTGGNSANPTVNTDSFQAGASSAMKTSRSVSYGRLVFISGLALVAAALGYLAYFLIHQSEIIRAEERFDSLSERALSMAKNIMEEKKLTIDSLAFVAAAANPYAAQWPNVFIEGYAEIATSLRLVTEGQGVSFCPIVTPGGQEQESFESFSYELFRNQSLPENSGISSFGKGIFSFGTDPVTNETASDRRFHITSGWTYYQSPRNVLVPFLQSDLGYHSALMLNVHFEHTRGRLIDQIMDCSEERQAAGDSRECGGITDLMWSPTNHDVDPVPAGIIFVPIYPKFDNTTLTGFIVAKTIFHVLLRRGFTEDVDGVHAVLRTDSGIAHTYQIWSGLAYYVGEGDLHEKDAKYAASRLINPQYFGDFNTKYYLELYSTGEYEDSFHTKYPWIACFGAVAIIFFTSLLFFAYDFFVRKEFDNNKNLLQAKRQFVRFVSHEVRTPLTTVCMGLNLMQGDFATIMGPPKTSGSTTVREPHPSSDGILVAKENVEEWIQLSQQVVQNAETAVSVLNDLLNYDKIQMGTLSLELSLVSIWTTIEKVVSEFKIACAQKQVKLEMDYSALFGSTDEEQEQSVDTPSKLPTDVKRCRVLADSIRIAQVIRNLVSNGLKFSKMNGTLIVRVMEKPLAKGAVQEQVLLYDEGPLTLWRRGEVSIEVIDNGVGMTKDQVRNVFKDGTQFNANKLQAGGGSGLGLNIAKGITAQHGGELTCQSEGMDKGTTFALSLPLYDPPDDNVDKETTCFGGSTKSISEGEESYDIPELNILVVDDSTTNRKMCMRLLTKHGHTCQEASNGLEGLNMVQDGIKNQKPFECILLDYEMPSMNGPEACKAIRALGSDSYIVGLTGNVLSEDVEHFRNCGADWVLAKPFRLETLEQLWVEAGITPNDVGHVETGSGMIRVSSDTALELRAEKVTFGDEES